MKKKKFIRVVPGGKTKSKNPKAKKNPDGSFVAQYKSYQHTARSVRRAKAGARAETKYRSNLYFIVENDSSESSSAISIKSKTESSLKNKYKDIKA